jgi:hypothetical protein
LFAYGDEEKSALLPRNQTSNPIYPSIHFADELWKWGSLGFFCAYIERVPLSPELPGCVFALKFVSILQETM